MTSAHDIVTIVSDPDVDLRWELESVISGNHNLLLEGPNDWTESMLRCLAPLLRVPVRWTTGHALPTLPAWESGSLVVEDIGELQLDDRARLFEWMNEGRRRVISTTVHSLFAAVVQGAFDEALYYRLNVIRLCASDHRSRSTAVLAEDRTCS